MICYCVVTLGDNNFGVEGAKKLANFQLQKATTIWPCKNFYIQQKEKSLEQELST